MSNDFYFDLKTVIIIIIVIFTVKWFKHKILRHFLGTFHVAFHKDSLLLNNFTLQGEQWTWDWIIVKRKNPSECCELWTFLRVKMNKTKLWAFCFAFPLLCLVTLTLVAHSLYLFICNLMGPLEWPIIDLFSSLFITFLLFLLLFWKSVLTVVYTSQLCCFLNTIIVYCA